MCETSSILITHHHSDTFEPDLKTASKTTKLVKDQDLKRLGKKILLLASLDEPSELLAVLVSLDGGFVLVAAGGKVKR